VEREREDTVNSIRATRQRMNLHRVWSVEVFSCLSIFAVAYSSRSPNVFFVSFTAP
jgi:hypothetical protein